MSDDEAFTDIANAIGRLRIAFLKHNLTPPKSIELGDHDAGDRFRHAVGTNMVLTQPRLEGRDDPELVCHFMGIEIRYPGHWRALRGGGRELI